MFMAIAAEPTFDQKNKEDYKVWYLDMNDKGRVIGIGVKSKKELIQSLFDSYKKHGHSNWRVFRKNSDRSYAIELHDFISKNMFENTHFGDLPTLSEFQKTLNSLRMNLELREIA